VFELSLKEKLKIYANKNLNVLFIGTHGIGKTTVAKEVIEEDMKMNYAYYSCGTLDPWADVVGIPVTDKEEKSLDFYKPKKMKEAEAIFFDELNRAHPRVLNAVLEIIQFKTVNGESLPKLKFVWAAINPPDGDYQVEMMDKALEDRFHCYITMNAKLDSEYLSKCMDKKIVNILSDWWHNDLSEEQRKIVTPRRVEYIGRNIANSVPWTDCLPYGQLFPIASLKERLDAMKLGKKTKRNYTKKYILSHIDEIVKDMKDDVSIAMKIKNLLKDFEIREYFEARDIIENMPSEWLKDLQAERLPIFTKKFKDTFKENKIKLSNYPKIKKVFGI